MSSFIGCHRGWHNPVGWLLEDGRGSENNGQKSLKYRYRIGIKRKIGQLATGQGGRLAVRSNFGGDWQQWRLITRSTGQQVGICWQPNSRPYTESNCFQIGLVQWDQATVARKNGQQQSSSFYKWLVFWTFKRFMFSMLQSHRWASLTQNLTVNR